MENMILSTKSPLRTGAYKNSRVMFFMSSKVFEAQITDLFDEVWPTVTALKNLRWQVQGYYQESGADNNRKLSAKFVEPEDKTNRPNLYRICIDNSWEDTEYRVARNLLVNIFACYEEWCDAILKEVGLELKGKRLQYPNLKDSITNIISGGNHELIALFSSLYQSKNKNFDFDKLEDWLKFYRFFKEMRNSIMHTGGEPTDKVFDAYSVIKDLTAEDLGVKELPEYFIPQAGKPLQLSLRGVVGFSQIVLKLVSTLDVKFISSKGADQYFANAILAKCGHVEEPKRVNIETALKKSLFDSGFNMPDDVETLHSLFMSLGIWQKRRYL